jgi:hypothetical protein
MATADQLAALRVLIAEPDNIDPYTDARLDTLLDTGVDPRSIAASLWREKAAGYTILVDVQEGNSKRSLSQLQKQALGMAGSFEAEVAGESVEIRRGSRTRKIERQ